MRPFDAKEILDWWKSVKEPVIQHEPYFSPFKVGTDEWREDVEKHSQEVNGVKIIGRVIK